MLAGISKDPSSGMPLIDPAKCSQAFLDEYWKFSVSVANNVDEKDEDAMKSLIELFQTYQARPPTTGSTAEVSE